MGPQRQSEFQASTIYGLNKFNFSYRNFELISGIDIAVSSIAGLQVLESGQFEHFWDILSFTMNGVVFFFAGAASVNFLLRSDWPPIRHA
eukprot:scaffold270182_cov29-Prasinocladus_malaysianus.AAC.1